ncbi:MAG: hypothetical protein HYS12_20450 [Planctomycetes bacterium]|nr:hypothetical protein [Planctomycetota bacterium]
MTLSKRTRLVAGLVLATLLSSGAVAALVIRACLQNNEYPDPPFVPVGRDFPRLIPLSERPNHEDGEALERYRAERRKIARWFKEHGAYARATPEEKKALDANTEGRYIEARELAEKVLAESPESVPALYVLANALAEAEGNLPQALHRIRTARHLLEARGRADSEDADAREWYIRSLWQESYILHLMDLRAEELRAVEVLEKVYGEELPWMKSFALLKLERFDEAREAMERTAQTGRWVRRALNDRILYAWYQSDRGEMYRISKECAEHKAASALIWNNFSGSCLSDFRFDEADKALEKCLSFKHRDFVRSPYIWRSTTHLARGRLSEAWDALNKADAERKKREQSTLEQDRAEMANAVAAFLLVLGNSAEAEARARQAWERPDRNGSSTDKKEYATFASGILLWTALHNRVEELHENGESGGLLASREQKRLELEAWTVRRSLLSLLDDETFLNHALRPYLPESPTTESWLLGTMVQLLPPGVAAEAVRQARAAEDHPKAVPYFDALEAELALRRGRAAQALELARQALDGLPAAERLLRGRVAAIAAEAARQQGQADDCKAHWAQALADFPAAARLLQIAIPVQMEDDGSPLARELARQLLRSPRFRADPAGLRVVLKGGDGRLVFELFRNDQAIHCSGSVPGNGEDEEVVGAALKLAHEKLMSPSFSLTPIQLNRLGSTSAGSKASEDAEEVLKKVRGD